MPNISVSFVESGQILSYDIAADLTIGDLKSFINAETGVSTDSLALSLNGQALTNDAQTLQAAGVKDHDMLVGGLRHIAPEASQQGQPAPSNRPNASAQRAPQQSAEYNAGIEDMRQRLLRSSLQRDGLEPELANALNDPTAFREAVLALGQSQRQREEERIARLTSGEVNEENQAEIAEYIRLENVEQERQLAMQENPEFFVPVTMLYIDLEVNGHPVKAFVDSGAQATILSPACAEACNVTRLIDTRFAGIARGVGTSKILGKVHRTTVRIGDAELPCGFTVMEGKDIDMLLGLDMLKRYQASIDLHQNRLVLFGGVSVPFLPESQIPKRFLEALDDEPTVQGPGGTAIGAQSGAIKPSAASSSGAAGSATSASNFSGAGRSLGGPAAPVAAPRPVAAPQRSAAQPFPQASIDALVALGASPAQAVEALRASGGNVELAAGIVYDQF